MDTVDYSKKMTRLKMTFCFIAILMLMQCKSGSSEFVAGDLVKIDVSQIYAEKEFYIQDIAKVEYIPLETNTNTLMRFRTDAIIHVSDDYIIAKNYNDGDIFVFDGQGKSKYSFNHKGQGPMEYNVLWDIAFDEKAKEIFVFDLYKSNIHVYSIDGKYKRTLDFFSGLSDINMYNFDDETLLVYDNSNVRSQAISDMSYANRPYLLISKNDGSTIDSLNIHLPVRLSNSAVWRGEQDGQQMTYSMSIPITTNRSYGKNFIIADWSCDTIYRLTPNCELQPMIVREPPVQSTDPKILISNFLTTNKFILLGIYVMDYKLLKDGGNISQKQLIYDFETGQTNEYRFKNKDITSANNVRIWEAITPGNTGVSMYDVSFLFDLNEKGEIKGDLKELLNSLDEDNNPVLMKVKFFN